MCAYCHWNGKNERHAEAEGNNHVPKAGKKKFNPSKTKAEKLWVDVSMLPPTREINDALWKKNLFDLAGFKRKKGGLQAGFENNLGIEIKGPDSLVTVLWLWWRHSVEPREGGRQRIRVRPNHGEEAVGYFYRSEGSRRRNQMFLLSCLPFSALRHFLFFCGEGDPR